MKLRGLYAITPEHGPEFLERVNAAIDGGIAALQYRNKTDSFSKRSETAKAFAARCRSRGVPFIVNDDIHVAVASGADGVHLGRDDVARVVSEISRVLKKGGTCCVQMPTRFGVRCICHQLRRRFRDSVSNG
jgi:thiamine-phosphate diphosphorylase